MAACRSTRMPCSQAPVKRDVSRRRARPRGALAPWTPLLYRSAPTLERWPRGRRRRFAKPLYGPKAVSRVRIPPSPPGSSRRFSVGLKEEEEGFEPPALSRYGFQDRRLRPLGHSSGATHLSAYEASTKRERVEVTCGPCLPRCSRSWPSRLPSTFRGRGPGTPH